MNCMDCRFHDVIDDPDPHDSFCSHYEAVICHKMTNPNPHTSSRYKSDQSEYRVVSGMCDSGEKRSRSKTPEWCPLDAKEKRRLAHNTRKFESKKR